MDRPAAPWIGTAGWAIPRAVADAFDTEGSSLRRYASRLGGAEINSTFYRSHRPSTYARWAADTPDGFLFAVKAPKAMTHEARLKVEDQALAAFVGEIAPLGARLGPILVQLPPSLAFEKDVAERFFLSLRSSFDGPVACEPRHGSWFEDRADDLLDRWRVARVAADPPRHPLDRAPGGWRGLAYWRWHGAPRPYYSSYGEAELSSLARDIEASGAAQRWCVFDNTASGAAAANALSLAAAMGAGT